MTTKSTKYQVFSKEERNYWKNLHINIDSYCDKWDEGHFQDLKKKLKLFEDSEIKQVIDHYKLPKKSFKNFKSILLNDLRCMIDFYCVVQYSFINPKVISQIFSIPIDKNLVNKKEVIKAVFNEHTKKELPSLNLMLTKQKAGKGNFNFSFNTTLTESDYDSLLKALPQLCVFLRRNDKRKKIYHFRSSYKSKERWYFTILKETSDIIVPAIPENSRILRGEYIHFTISPINNSIEINTPNKLVAYEIRNFIAKKIDNRLIYKQKSSSYNPLSFFNKILEDGNNVKTTFPMHGLQLVDARFRETTLNTEIQITDSNHKNNIIQQLKTLKDKDIIKLNDFSEFKYLTFYYKGLQFKINIEESKWGQNRLHLFDKGKPIQELFDFKSDFEREFKVDLDTYLTNSDNKIDEIRILRNILNKSTLEASLPDPVESVLLDLITNKIIDKPTHSSQRRCINEKCRKLTWQKGDCPSCGNELKIEGNHIDIKFNKRGINDFIIGLLKSTKVLDIRKTKKQISNTAFEIIDILDKVSNPLTIYISTTIVPSKLLDHYNETGYPLLIILCRFKTALYNDIIKRGFECIDLADSFVHKTDPQKIATEFDRIILAQKRKWQEKLIVKGNNSYNSMISKKEGYNDQNFEIDTYNILHELFIVGDRLGGKFAGVPAPDGIVSIDNRSTPLKRYCFAWDCKFSLSVKGYQLNEKPEKHRHYIHKLKNNLKVKLFGGLLTYAIVSQNMDKSKYETFYSKLSSGFRWQGNIVFIDINIILAIYQFYKENSTLILSNPSGFYKPLFRIFEKIWKRDSNPYPFISEKRLKVFIDELKVYYPDNKLNFNFERSEFKK